MIEDVTGASRGDVSVFQRRFLGRTVPVVLVHESDRRFLWRLRSFADHAFDSERYISDEWNDCAGQSLRLHGRLGQPHIEHRQAYGRRVSVRLDGEQYLLAERH